MATTKAKASKGTKLQRGDGGGTETFTDIGDILSFSGPGESADVIEVTSLDDTSKEFISSGIVDAGEVTFELNFAGSATTQQNLRADLRAGVLRNFKVLLNDHATNPTTFAFSAFVVKFDGPSAGVGEQYKGSVTLRTSGLPSITYAP